MILNPTDRARLAYATKGIYVSSPGARVYLTPTFALGVSKYIINRAGKFNNGEAWRLTIREAKKVAAELNKGHEVEIARPPDVDAALDSIQWLDWCTDRANSQPGRRAIDLPKSKDIVVGDDRTFLVEGVGFAPSLIKPFAGQTLWSTDLASAWMTEYDKGYQSFIAPRTLIEEEEEDE